MSPKQPPRCCASAFDELELEEIISFAVGTNRRSIAVMQRIGMRYDGTSISTIRACRKRMPHLRPHVLYRLTREDWRER